MFWNELPSGLKKILALTIAGSIVAGGLLGAITGVLATAWAESQGWPWFNGLIGLSPGAVSDNLAKAKDQVVVEDSAAVDAVAKATPAVVSIIVTQDLSKLYNRPGQRSPWDDFFFSFPLDQATPPSGKQEIGGGTGFIITTDGLIITNRHVVESEGAEYTVILNDDTRYEAQVLARDTVNDIAVLKIKADNLPVLDLGDSDQIKIGQTVIAIGNSLGEFRNTVTKGVVSGINRRVVAGDGSGSSEVIEEAIQTDAAINSGNSGGPLLDLFGKVVGVNTAVSREGQLIGFAIPINAVKSIIQSVQKYGRIIRTFLGVRYVLLNKDIAQANNITDVADGALIVRGEARTDLAVTPGSPADKAGLVENDIILEVEGEKVTVENTLTSLLNKYKVGDKVKLKVYHKGSIKEVEVELAERK